MALALGVLAALVVHSTTAELQGQNERWITAWATSQNNLAANSVSNTTVRMIARVTIAGTALRVRLDNTFGTSPLTVGNAYAAPRIQGASVAPGSSRQVLFNGSSRVSVPPGGTVTSDPVRMKVLAQQDLAVTLYIPDANARPSQHSGAQVTSYVAPDGSGDMSQAEDGARFTGTTTSMWWLKAIDVAGSSSTGAVIAFGDSITDGTCSTVDAHDRWEDLLGVRLALAAAERGRPDAHKAIVNEGIAGNTVTREGLQPVPDSPPGMERLERDVLSHHGVTHVIVFMGTNDIRREAPASQVIAGTQDVVTRVKARGMKAIGVTIIPRHNRPAVDNNTGWSDAKTRFRHEVNQWIRTKAPFDAVIDFDKVVQDPGTRDLIYPPFNCGDGIHPSPRGYHEMGRSVRLELFR